LKNKYMRIVAKGELRYLRMVNAVDNRNRMITTLLNGTNLSLKQVVSVEHTISKPNLIKDAINVRVVLLIVIICYLKGKLVLDVDIHMFGLIGEKMFGMEVTGDMLSSFSGEFGNMLAGSISTNIASEGISIDITSPSLIEGQAKISGFKLAIQTKVSF